MAASPPASAHPSAHLRPALSPEDLSRSASGPPAWPPSTLVTPLKTHLRIESRSEVLGSELRHVSEFGGRSSARGRPPRSTRLPALALPPRQNPRPRGRPWLRSGRCPEPPAPRSAQHAEGGVDVGTRRAPPAAQAAVARAAGPGSSPESGGSAGPSGRPGSPHGRRLRGPARVASPSAHPARSRPVLSLLPAGGAQALRQPEGSS